MKHPVLLLVLASLLQAQVPQVTVKNHLEYTAWEEYERDILENWTGLTLQSRYVEAGLRTEINNPPDPFIFPQDTLVDRYSLSYAYLEAFYKNFSGRLGTFYTTFGRGLVLRTYEDRNLRVDNSIRGVNFRYSGDLLSLEAISGKMRDRYNRHPNTVSGIDGELAPFPSLRIGGSYLQQSSDITARERLWAARLNYIHGWWDLYAEAARPEWHDTFSYYLALSAAFSMFSVTMELKDYDNLAFRNNLNTDYNAAPSLSREHSYTLLNRHPHALNLNNEKGYQIEAAYYPGMDWQLLFNTSLTTTHDGLRIFEEYYGEVAHTWSDRLNGLVALGWNFDRTTRTENITPLFDIYYNLNERDQIYINFQHQHVINTLDKSEYDDELVVLEFSRSPILTLAMVAEYTNQNQLRNVRMDRNFWLYGNVTLSFWRNQQLSLLYGSRQAGFVCVGGICRYEPEFKGLEIRLINRF